ncbi:MAG: hypothetical protein ABI992_07905 [Chthoniobacterales bacterium]
MKITLAPCLTTLPRPSVRMNPATRNCASFARLRLLACAGLMFGCAAVKAQPTADLEMEKKLVGRWDEVPKVSPDPRLSQWVYKEDHTFKGNITSPPKNGQREALTLEGKWSVRNSVLIHEVTKTSVPKPLPPQLRWGRERIVSLQNGLLTTREDDGTLNRRRKRPEKSVKHGGAHRATS